MRPKGRLLRVTALVTRVTVTDSRPEWYFTLELTDVSVAPLE
jgi:hypothetical protein